MSVLPFDASRVAASCGARRGPPDPVVDITVARSAGAGRHVVSFEVHGYDDGTGRIVWTGSAQTLREHGRRWDRQISDYLRSCADGWAPPPVRAAPRRHRIRGRQ